MFNKKIWIVAGGTIGHIKPALILKKELEHRGFVVQWISSSRDIQFIQYEREFRDSFPLFLKGLPRSTNIVQWIIFLILLILSSFKIQLFYYRLKPDYVIGCGGFVSFLPLLLAWIFKKPYFILEQNSKMGLVNRLFFKHAKRVFLGFPIQGIEINERVIETGNPIAPLSTSAEKAKASFFDHISNKTFIIGILGGSLGALSLLRWIKKIIPERMSFYQKGYDIRFIVSTGSKHFKSFYLDTKQYPWIKSVPFIEEMELFYSAVNCLISRAGGMTLTEITQYQIQSIVVPYKFASENHQYHNASTVVKKYPCIDLIEEEKLSELTLNSILECKVNFPDLKISQNINQPQFKIAEIIEKDFV